MCPSPLWALSPASMSSALAGESVAAGALTLDLIQMQKTVLQRDGRAVLVQAGATLGQ